MIFMVLSVIPAIHLTDKGLDDMKGFRLPQDE